ncbi:MAG: damage-control phosphatase ARMT1 family protein [Candidatus Kapaibacterium sp.]
MKIEPECIPCALNSFNRGLGETRLAADEKMAEVKAMLARMAAAESEMSPPGLGRIVHRRIKEFLGIDDPFAEEKRHFNELMMDKYDKFRENVWNSPDKFTAALNLALFGNVIDFGLLTRLGIEELIERGEEIQPAIDHSENLRAGILKSNNILYLGDNCGEIVLDRLLIEAIIEEFGPKDITFATRGMPIINDITRRDAEFVGIDKIARVIDNGYDAPGTILEYCSREFRQAFERAELIIAKGQGNFESLTESPANIYYLLTAKCPVVARWFGVSKGARIVASARKMNRPESH